MNTQENLGILITEASNFFISEQRMAKTKTMLNIDVLTHLSYHGKRIDEPQIIIYFQKFFLFGIKIRFIMLTAYSQRIILLNNSSQRHSRKR